MLIQSICSRNVEDVVALTARLSPDLVVFGYLALDLYH